MRIALGVEYEGTAFHGWQRQAGGGTVQDALELALTRIAGESVATICAGRTDAGVHALQQVVHFDTAAKRPLSAWERGVNTLLPSTVAVRWAREVDEQFHARYSAHGRRYRYLLLNRPQRPGLWQRHQGWFHLPLDLARMQAAAANLLGEHDFSAFRAAACQARSPVRNLWQADVHQSGSLFVFDFAANAFLHHMVRNLVGCLVMIGKGARDPEWIGELLRAGDRSLAAPTFAPQGLYFCGPEYPAYWNFPTPDTLRMPGVVL